MQRLVALLFISSLALAQTPQADPKQRAREARDLAKQGSPAIPALTAFLSDPDVSVRTEAVKSIVTIGTQYGLDALVKATADNDPEIQIRATEGLVNFYLPGYVQAGLSGSLHRMGAALKRTFTDTNDQTIPPDIEVRPQIITALGTLVRGGASLPARASATRALGILRGRAAIPELLAALRSKDNDVIFESLNALRKIGDPATAPGISFLLGDLEEKVQLAALETTGLLRNKEAAPAVRGVLERARSVKVRRGALMALAMIADEKDRGLFGKYEHDRDDGMRAGAAEGIGRVGFPADIPPMQKDFDQESKMAPRLAQAFALVRLGQLHMDEFSPLQYLVNTLNSKAFRGVAQGYLVELSRRNDVRQALYPVLKGATKEEKIELSQILAASGDRDTIRYLEPLTTDSDADVADQGLKSLRILKARVP